MGRKVGSKNKKKSNARRTAYQTYSEWYDKYTKTPDKAQWFGPKYTKEEFEREYKLTTGNNRARKVAMSQEYVDRKFEREYTKWYKANQSPFSMGGNEAFLDLSDPADRRELFYEFAANYSSWKEAKEAFKKMFY